MSLSKPALARHALARRAPLLWSIASLLLAACGTLPQPFSHDGKVTNPLVATGERAGINVIPVAGTNHGAALALRLAEAFREEDLAAHSQAEPGAGYTVVGKAVTGAVVDGTNLRVRFNWQILDPRGRPGGIFHQQTTVNRKAWNQGSPALLRSLAGTAVAGLTPMISGPRAKPVARQRLITIFDVNGAPGDGRVSLRRSLAFELRKLGFRVTESDIQGTDPVVLMGEVKVVPSEAGSERVEITWSVLAGDGRLLGNVTQNNQVKAGSLKRFWGVTAALVARAAAPGIKDLIERTAGTKSP